MPLESQEKIITQPIVDIQYLYTYCLHIFPTIINEGLKPTYIIHWFKEDIVAHITSIQTAFSARFIKDKNHTNFDETKKSPMVKYFEH